ncbi:Di-copper centre-containing protein [Martensiomyces pterosporus]|nr:Di-copper centre-containing protein [Martensiomyces pterosporus]
MKFSTSLVFAALAALGCAQDPPRCSGSTVRRNAASLSPQEWQSISTVLNAMNQDGWIARFGGAHDRLFDQVHGNSAFFPFHRRFLMEFERVGRNYDPNFSIPYWDATQSFRNPTADPLLTSFALGTNGQGNDHCLANGIQGNTQLSYPNQHCLRRNFDGGNSDGSSMRAWYAPEIISSYIQSDTSLAAFREDIEYSIHGAVHLGLSGDMDSGYAAQDFSFMVHHANLDRLWWDWQNIHGSFLAYDGPGPAGPATLSDRIPEDNDVPFNGDIVSSVMVLGYGDVCYTYDSSSSPPQSYPSGGNSGAAAPAAANSNNNNNNRNNSNNNSNARPQGAAPQQSGGNRTPVVSGSSNMANRLLESTGLRNSLGSNFVNQFFPSLNGGFSPFSRRAYQEKASNCGDPLPFPPRLTPEWIKMHKFDPDRVEAFHAHACTIIEVLNNSTYKSPY